ncbi:hypothetical protein [Nocardioides marmoribigeumensis]|uniref:LppP/LprE family lipoprotein n=1 Tax=Nocardioides marmoribigeumensis TaxID=433649 RepID=A0ABU2BSV4_9ACTN|nr:hypothetical protein [Nocardioides marmoribigeumensis]MDR7361346.1 hypothetical protein [Nocardioides marmoribigeumensis]
MRRTRTAPRVGGGPLGALVCALLLLAGCGGSGSTGDTTQDTAGDTVVEDTSTPEAEDTAATEQADDSGNQDVAVELPGLPIGGSSIVVSDTLQCADVGWTNPPDLPDWIAVTVTGVELSPEGEFALSDETCEGDTPPCLEGEVRITTTQRCYVAVTWTGSTQDPGLLSFTSGEISCPADRVDECESFKAEVEAAGPQSIELQPAPSADDGG